MVASPAAGAERDPESAPLASETPPFSPAGTRFIYFVQSDFHAHAHVHRLKIRYLRQAGLQAEVVAAVSWRARRRHPALYQEDADSLDVRILGVPHRAMAGMGQSLYLLRALRHQDVICQVLRSAWPYVGWLRRVAGRYRHRFHCLLELEGDHEAEADYLSRHPFRPGFYDSAIAELKQAAPRVSRQAAEADGLVLMSPAHIRLWESRLHGPLRAVSMPAFFDAKAMRFAVEPRLRLRRELRLEDQVVLVYSGNVIHSWQNFGPACQLVARLRSQGVPVALLALVRKTDHGIAGEFIQRHKIEAASRLLWCPAGSVGGYLAAADLGLFLRDDHPMNRIVTSAKLGEYLACGLPVVTTGVGALYHDYIRREGLGVFIQGPKAWSAEQTETMLALARRSQDPQWRAACSAKAHAAFVEGDNPAITYVNFVRSYL